MGQNSQSQLPAEGSRGQHRRGLRILFDWKRVKSRTFSLEKAVALFNKWKNETAQILAVCESPLQQRRGIITMGLQGKVANVSIDQKLGKKSAAVVLETPAGNLSLPIGHCSFAYGESKPAMPRDGRADSTTAASLWVFFPSKEVFVFYEIAGALFQNNRSWLQQHLSTEKLARKTA